MHSAQGHRAGSREQGFKPKHSGFIHLLGDWSTCVSYKENHLSFLIMTMSTFIEGLLEARDANRHLHHLISSAQ